MQSKSAIFDKAILLGVQVDTGEGKIRHVPYRDSKLTFLLKVKSPLHAGMSGLQMQIGLSRLTKQLLCWSRSILWKAALSFIQVSPIKKINLLAGCIGRELEMQSGCQHQPC